MKKHYALKANGPFPIKKLNKTYTTILELYEILKEYTCIKDTMTLKRLYDGYILFFFDDNGEDIGYFVQHSKSCCSRLNMIEGKGLLCEECNDVFMLYEALNAVINMYANICTEE